MVCHFILCGYGVACWQHQFSSITEVKQHVPALVIGWVTVSMKPSNYDLWSCNHWCCFLLVFNYRMGRQSLDEYYQGITKMLLFPSAWIPQMYIHQWGDSYEFLTYLYVDAENSMYISTTWCTSCRCTSAEYACGRK